MSNPIPAIALLVLVTLALFVLPAVLGWLERRRVRRSQARHAKWAREASSLLFGRKAD